MGLYQHTIRSLNSLSRESQDELEEQLMARNGDCNSQGLSHYYIVNELANSKSDLVVLV